MEEMDGRGEWREKEEGRCRERGERADEEKCGEKIQRKKKGGRRGEVESQVLCKCICLICCLPGAIDLRDSVCNVIAPTTSTT